MSASNVNNAVGPRQVPCETSDNDLIPVDLDVLLLSGTFKEMYEDLGLEEPDVFPGVFPAKTANSHTFNMVVDWCKEHKDCDLDQARINEIYADNPWLWSVFPGAHIENAIFIPNEVLLTIFEKLPREDLERLQLVSTQFGDVVVSSNKLSEEQGPSRVVTMVEFGAPSYGRFSQKIGVWLRDDLAKRLKLATVQKLRLGYAMRWDDNVYYADIKSLSLLLPVKSAWKDATVEVSTSCFLSNAPFEFVFT
ncbi:hypothetical protein AAVH_27963 [Aphelenchoides avenae]|nr:hypothetical protein AAVH_27963 [Aphelenchus avenae]